MGNILHEIYDFLKSSEKETLIRQSGSTKDSRNERVRSGQSHLYKKYGMESEVIEVRFKQKIAGGILNQALITTCKRCHPVYHSGRCSYETESLKIRF